MQVRHNTHSPAVSQAVLHTHTHTHTDTHIHLLSLRLCCTHAHTERETHRQTDAHTHARTYTDSHTLTLSLSLCVLSLSLSLCVCVGSLSLSLCVCVCVFSQVPLLVQIQQKWRKVYAGECQGPGVRSDFEMVHLRKAPGQYTHLSGLLDVFKNKIVSSDLEQGYTRTE